MYLGCFCSIHLIRRKILHFEETGLIMLTKGFRKHSYQYIIYELNNRKRTVVKLKFGHGFTEIDVISWPVTN